MQKILKYSAGHSKSSMKYFEIPVWTLRYLGTRGWTPGAISVEFQTAFENGAQPLPTYIHASDITEHGSRNRTDARAISFRAHASGIAAQGFTGGFITEEAPIATSIYHGGDVELLHRFGYGLFLRANYTYSRTMDDATNDLAPALSIPGVRKIHITCENEVGRSALDVPNKVAITFLYDPPQVKWSSILQRTR